MSLRPSDFNLRWSDGNTKVQKLAGRFGKTVSFGLPAGYSVDGFKVCIGLGSCASVCFARQGHYIRPGVIATREHNLRLARGSKSRFARMAIADLHKIRARLVRCHDSGDFFDQAYLDAWFKIARALPGTKFYCYTKSVRLDFSRKPDNFAITFSEGGAWDNEIDMTQSHSRIFSTDYARRQAGYGNGSNTDLLSVNAKPGTKIGLIYHGVALLTPAQDKHFR
jgi:Gene product 88